MNFVLVCLIQPNESFLSYLMLLSNTFQFIVFWDTLGHFIFRSDQSPKLYAKTKVWDQVNMQRTS